MWEHLQDQILCLCSEVINLLGKSVIFTWYFRHKICLMFGVENLIKNGELKILVPHNLVVPVNFQPRLCISNSWDVYLKINDKIV